MSDDTTDTVTIDTAESEAALALPELGITLARLDLIVRSRIEAIADTDAPGDMMALYAAVESLYRMAKEWKAKGEQRFVDYLTARGEPGKPDQVQSGTVRYRVATPKTEKPALSHAEMLERVFDACGGDFAKVADCLASSAWKPGQIEQYMGEAARKALFAVEYRDTIEDGKPNKKLTVVDERYLK